MRIRPPTILLLVSPLALVVAADYVQCDIVGLPRLPASTALTVQTATEPYGFPPWLRITQYVNFLVVVLLICSGLEAEFLRRLRRGSRIFWRTGQSLMVA